MLPTKRLALYLYNVRKKMNEEKQGLMVTNQLHPDPITWVEKYADFLYRFGMSRLRDEEVARDLVQDTFLAALQQLDRFKANSSEKTWLSAILKNKIADFYRKQASKGLKKIIQSEFEQIDLPKGSKQFTEHLLAGARPTGENRYKIMLVEAL